MALRSVTSCFSELGKGNGGWQADIQVTRGVISGCSDHCASGGRFIAVMLAESPLVNLLFCEL